MENPKTFYQKLLSVQSKLKTISESGKNSHMGYSYATSSDVILPVRKECNSEGLFLSLSVDESKIEKGVASVKVILTVIDCESGEKIQSSAYGYSEDWSYKENRPNGDKAVYKATTGATKYVIRSMFLLPSGDDPEDEAGGNFSPAREEKQYSPSASKISEAQSKRLYAKGYSAGLTNEEIKAVLNNHGFASALDIPRDKYDSIIANIESAKLAPPEKPRAVWQDWQSENDALAYAINQLPDMTMQELTKRYGETPPKELPNGKLSKAIAWFELVETLKVVPF